MENTVLEKFHQGRQSLGTFSAIGSPLAVESLRYTGLDYVIVDTEHSPAGIESAAAQIAAAQGAGLTALARANEISRTAVLRLLDVGAQGVVVPCVETVEEVRELVRYAKFAPLGNRGFCPTRDGGWGHAAHAVSISGYMETSNRETLLLPQCETVGCLEHIEEITAMDGVDGIFVGPFDLSIALGHPGEFNAPVVHDAILRVQAACKRSGKLSIIFTGSAAASRQRFADAKKPGADFRAGSLFIPSLPASVPLRTLPGQSPFPHWQYPAPAWSPLPGCRCPHPWRRPCTARPAGAQSP